MNLSDKAEPDYDVGVEYYLDKDVKQFIKELKTRLDLFKIKKDTGYGEDAVMYKTEDVYGRNLVEKIIDELAGDKLI